MCSDACPKVQSSRVGDTPCERYEHTRADSLARGSTATDTEDWTSAQARTRRPTCVQSGEGHPRGELITSHLDLAGRLARRFSYRGEKDDDLVQVASLALVAAARRFDADRGVMFSTFATATITGELKRHFRDRGWVVRPPRGLQELGIEIAQNVDRLAQELGQAPTVFELAKATGSTEREVLKALEASQGRRASPLDVHDGEGQRVTEVRGSEESGYAHVDNHQVLVRAMEGLSARDRSLVRLRFVGGLSQSEIAARIGVSQMQVSRLLGSCMRRLRTIIAENEDL
jgi:RNA polymerase sigma-B factor